MVRRRVTPQITGPKCFHESWVASTMPKRPVLHQSTTGIQRAVRRNRADRGGWLVFSGHDQVDPLRNFFTHRCVLGDAGSPEHLHRFLASFLPTVAEEKFLLVRCPLVQRAKHDFRHHGISYRLEHFGDGHIHPLRSVPMRSHHSVAVYHHEMEVLKGEPRVAGSDTIVKILELRRALRVVDDGGRMSDETHGVGIATRAEVLRCTLTNQRPPLHGIADTGIELSPIL
mmetsp:Transcript_89403/g.239588  ORF Transcript_89403/g.239588 Transcript_89403/m.239588 type:complete len:228 (-) Transcript_89403:914-1597(-)